MFRSIAVTTDFSELSHQAFEPAATLAKKFESRVQVVHVDCGPPIQASWQCACESPEETARRTDALERKLVDLVRGEPLLQEARAVPRLLQGESAEALRRLEEGEEMDLLVIATRGHEDVKHFIPGSFAASALHACRCPVLIFRSVESPAQKAFQPRHILVPYDFSPSSKAALEVANAIAGAFHASVKLLSVAKPGTASADAAELSLEGAAEHLERATPGALERLRRVASSGWGNAPASVVLRTGRPSEEILKEAESAGADLIVMGSRGLSRIEQITLGSVAESAIQNARCPVLVVKAEDARKPLHVSPVS